MYVQACKGVWRGQVLKAANNESSNFLIVDIFQDVVCKFEQSSFGRVEFSVRRLKRAETGRNRYVEEKACKSK